MECVNIFKEKKKIYRLLAIAMAEDKNVTSEEEMAIATVLMYRFCHSENRSEESMKVFRREGFRTFWRHITHKENNDGDMFDLFKVIREKLECFKIKFDIQNISVIDGFNFVYGSDSIQLSPELRSDLLEFILLKQFRVDAKRKQYSNSLSSATDYEFLKRLFERIKTDKSNSESPQSTTREYNINTLDEYYKIRIRPLVREYVELCMMCLLLVRQSLKELMTDINDSVGNSVFMNVNSLSKREKERELKEMVYIIKSDRSIMDREREAFRVVCKIFRVKGSTELWRRLSKETKGANLLSRGRRLGGKVYYKSTTLDVNDFNNIQQSICSFDIKGKIINGAFHVLQRCEIRKRDEMYISDKRWSKFAIWTFGISALILYFSVVDLVNVTENKGEILNVRNFFNLLESNYCSIVLYSGLLISVPLLLKWRWEYCKKNIKKFLTGLVGIVVILQIVKCCSEVELSKTIEAFFIPLTLVAMMLSIEWLIFMRQEYSGVAHYCGELKNTETRNTTILIVLVCAAIMIDVCLGIVELIAHSNLSESKEVVNAMDYVAKIASALILGCICFFAGKFLDMYRIQQQTDMAKMRECIKALDNRVNKKS